MAASQLDSTTTGNTAFGSSRAIPVPTGGGALQANDVVVVRLSRWESINPAITPPAGTWVQRTQMVSGSSKLDTFLKRLTAADSGTYTFSWTGSMWTTGQATAYRGIDPAANLATIPLHQLTGSGTSWPALTLNSVGAGVLDWHGFSETGGSHAVPTTPAFTLAENNDSDVQGFRVVATGSYTTSGGSSVSSALIASMLHLPEAGGGSNNTAAGPATETDAAQAAGRTRTSTVTNAAETDVAQAAGRTRTSVLGRSLETDTAQVVGRSRLTTAGPALETDAAQLAGRTRSSVAGPALETDVAQPIAGSGSTPAGPALEVDTAQPVARTRTSTVTSATETDTAQPVARTRLTATGPGLETDQARPVGTTRHTPVQPATETDVAQAAGNPGAIVRDLVWATYVEAPRWVTGVEHDRWSSSVEPDRYDTEVETL